MVINDRDNRSNNHVGPIYAEDHAEKFICKFCGKQYVSRGKFDPGNICRECEKKQNATLVGGPLNGEKAYD